MATVYDMQLSPTSAWFSQRQVIQGGTYVFEFRWNNRSALWYWDVLNSVRDGIVLGIPLQVNRDLLAQYPTLSLPQGNFVVIDQTGNNMEAGLASFNVSHKFYFLDTSADA